MYRLSHIGQILNNCPIIEVELINPNDPSKVVKANGLLDTGASRSAITTSLVGLIGLIPTGNKSIVTSATSTGTYNDYYVDIRVPTICSHFSITGNAVNDSFTAMPGVDFLIGYDVITTCESFTVFSDHTFIWKFK